MLLMIFCNKQEVLNRSLFCIHCLKEISGFIWWRQQHGENAEERTKEDCKYMFYWHPTVKCIFNLCFCKFQNVFGLQDITHHRKFLSKQKYGSGEKLISFWVKGSWCCVTPKDSFRLKVFMAEKHDSVQLRMILSDHLKLGQTTSDTPEVFFSIL